ncbi:metallopeptidase TldD-related protein [Sphingomonas sp. MMS24-JH45]
MALFTEEQARAICAKAVKMSKADECTATLSGAMKGNVRFAQRRVDRRPGRGHRPRGAGRVREADRRGDDQPVRRRLDRALRSPCRGPRAAGAENAEYVPIPGPQTYRASPTFSAATAALTPEARAQVAAASIAPCRAAKLVAAGFLEDGQSYVAFTNSKGNAGYQRATSMDYTCTVRTEDGRGGWVEHNVQDASQFSADTEIRTAMRKASASVEAKAIEPGKYTVILEPAAAAGLVSFMMNFFDARSADEGRSFLSKKGGGNKLGEQVFGPQVNITTDPWDPQAAVIPWTRDSSLVRRCRSLRAAR